MDTHSNARPSLRTVTNVIIAANKLKSQLGNNSSTGTVQLVKGGHNFRESTVKDKKNYRC